MVKKALIIVCLAALKCLAVDTTTLQESVIGPFGGLNTTDNPAIIGANQAQDMLNVDISPGGKSVKKRQGYGLDTTFTYSTTAVHGTYKFFDSSGNEIRLVGQDVGLYASVAGTAWVRVATGTLSATWQCTDYLGKAYCVTSSRDTPVRTDGTVSGTSYQTAIPAGTLIASTPDRLLVGNTASNPSRLSYSGSVNFTDFTLGTLITSSSFEDIAAPGSQLTHLAYRYGRWLWWKDQSFGFIAGTDQTNLQLVTVSDTIGTFDNTDIFWQGITYFRGTDAHIYAYDGAVLTPLTRDVTPTVTAANRRKANSWAQTSQSDFANGSSVPSGALSTSVSPGDIVPSSFSVTENSSSQWNNGTASNVTVNSSSLALSTNNSGNINDNGFEDSTFADNWTNSGGGNPQSVVSASPVHCGTFSPDTGSRFLSWTPNATTLAFELVDANDTTVLAQTNVTVTQACSYATYTISSSGQVGKRFKFKIIVTAGSSSGAYNRSNTSYILGGDITFRLAMDAGGGTSNLAIDTILLGSSTIATGTFTSKIFDTNQTVPTVQMQTNWSANTSTPTFELQGSNNQTAWVKLLSSTGTNTTVADRYFRYLSTFTINSTDNALTTLTSASVVARSSGTYLSAVNNASALSAWSTFGVTDSASNETITYYTRSSTLTFNVTSATPTWVAQTKNATVAASTGTYFQMRADFTEAYSTNTPAINDFTFNWYEGNASDKMYGTYYDYALWFAVSLGTTTSNNNRILRYDLLNQAWTLYDIPSNGFLIYNNYLYFGSASVGKLYKFGAGVTSDDNAAINSYWKSKDFFGASPFLDEDMRSLSWYAKSSSGTALSVTYQVNESTQTTYSVNLFNANSNIIRHNRNFPAGTLVNTINFKFGDNSTNPLWEVFAGGYSYVARPWNAN